MISARCDHTVHAHRHHNVWDRDLTPVLDVEPEQSVEFEVLEASGGQVSRSSAASALIEVDFERFNPVTGTVGVAPAAPGPHSVIPPSSQGGISTCGT